MYWRILFYAALPWLFFWTDEEWGTVLDPTLASPWPAQDDSAPVWAEQGADGGPWVPQSTTSGTWAPGGADGVTWAEQPSGT